MHLGIPGPYEIGKDKIYRRQDPYQKEQRRKDHLLSGHNS